MGIFDLVTNTVEGVLQAGANVVKAGVGVVVAPLDGGKTITDAADGVIEGLRKVGDADAAKQDGERGGKN